MALGSTLATAATGDRTPGQGFDVVRYELSLTPDIDGTGVSGVESIVLRSVEKGLQQIVFSPNALTVDRASVDGRTVNANRAANGIQFNLPTVLRRGQSAVLRIDYHGAPARGVVRSPTGVYTSYFACDWMFCAQDAPGDKAIFSLDLRVPSGMTTIGAGRLIGVQPAADHTEIHRWRSERPYPAYLYGFAAGRYARVVERIGNAQIEFLSDTVTEAELRALFGDTTSTIRFLGDKAGIGLPAGHYTQLLVPGDEAQEAATYSVIGKDEIALADPRDDWVIVHELAHQWWGNALTCATWRDFWLNEGITTFMTAAWKEHRYGRAAYEAELDVARQRLAKARDNGFDKPLAWAGLYQSLGTRRAVQYSKGALFMDHLRTLLGEKAFWSGLRHYTQAHAGGSVTSVDFQRAMESAAGRDLSAEFAEWVFGP